MKSNLSCKKLCVAFVICLFIAGSAFAGAPRTDNHMHVESRHLVARMQASGFSFLQEPRGDRSADAIVMYLDAAGFERGTVLSGGYLCGAPFLTSHAALNLEQRVRGENNFTALQALRYPGRIRGLMSFDPLQDFALREIERCARLGMAGIKLHFACNRIDVSNPGHLEKLRAVFRKAARKGLPLLVHYRGFAGPYDPETFRTFMDQVVLKSPGVTVQFAHCTGYGDFDGETEAVFRALIDYRNNHPELAAHLWVDMSGTMIDSISAREYPEFFEESTDADLARLAKALRDWGLDRTLFGSDYAASSSMNTRDYSRLALERLPLTEGEIEKNFTNPGPFWRQP